MFDILKNEYSYSFAVIGLKRKYNRYFSTRNAANNFMYELCDKYHIQIKEVWDDHHDKTYKCTNGVFFFIQKTNQ